MVSFFGLKLGADKKRIPFVVYAFTLVQVIVFIVELVRNCESPPPAAGCRVPVR